jgi:peptidoglycan hydrolase-like protein with peptidoglycan-binding domain
MLQFGSLGSGVAQLQKFLAKNGFAPKFGADGIFGQHTLAALKAYQQSKGMAATGSTTLFSAADGFDAKKSGCAKCGSAACAGCAGHSHNHTSHDGHTHDAPGAIQTENRAPLQGVRAGGGWGGSQGVADAAVALARQSGVAVTSTKRDLATTRRVGSSTGSDHFTGNTHAYAVDLGVAGAKGDKLAREIARKYGIPESSIGTYNRHIITVNGQKFSVQLLWKVAGHHDHIHFGIRRA